MSHLSTQTTTKHVFLRLNAKCRFLFTRRTTYGFSELVENTQNGLFFFFFFFFGCLLKAGP